MRRWVGGWLASAMLGVGLALLAAGCDRSVAWLDSRDRADPVMQKAAERLAVDDVDAAIRLYDHALEVDPKLAKAHLDLGLLWHDRRTNYVRAVYHYQRYLETRPDTEKRAMIEGRIRQATQLLVAGVIKRDRVADEKLALEQENARLKSDLAQVRAEADAWRERAAQAAAAAVQPVAPVERKTVVDAGVAPAERKTGVAGAGSVDRKVVASPAGGAVVPVERKASAGTAVPIAPVEKKVTAAPVASAVPAERKEPVVADAGRGQAGGGGETRTYKIQPGDTLESIALREYSDSEKWVVIYRANKATVVDPNRLQVGKVLVIP